MNEKKKIKENKKIKAVFLIVAIISLSICLTVFAVKRNTDISGAKESITNDNKAGFFTDEFYKSAIFERVTFNGTIYDLQESVKKIDVDKNDSKTKEDKEIKQNTRDILDSHENMKFFVVNKTTGESYTNTNYKDIKEAKENLKRYCNIDFSYSESKGVRYTKTIDGKKVMEASDRWTGEDSNGTIGDLYTDLDIYLSYPKKIIKYDQLLQTYYYFEEELNFVKQMIAVTTVGTILFVASLVMYKKTKAELFDKNSLLMKIISKIPLEIYILYFLGFIVFALDIIKELQMYQRGWISLSVAAISMTLLLIFLIIKQIQISDDKLHIIKNSISIKILSYFNAIIKNTKKSMKNIPLVRRFILVGFVGVIANIFGFYLEMMINYDYTYLDDIIHNYLITFLISTLGIVSIVIYMVKKLNYLNTIMEGTQKIKNGDINHEIEVKGNDSFTVLAENINNIGEGLDDAIEEKLKSERMKSELITNVSHDLKTPLTSIINYIELIKKEENIQPEHVNDYVHVLDSKSKRLKVLIEDLFEASKASSGNIELNMEKLDLKQLLRQSIGEMEDKLNKSNLLLKVNMPEEKVCINADGKRLNRVLENLLSNISKYSLQNTRVYIDMDIEDEFVKLTLKNISSYELNFDPEEIVERFKRADESRNTEGSGLGLAISKDLVKIQGGEFFIDIDGDLFKTEIKFKIAED